MTNANGNNNEGKTGSSSDDESGRTSNNQSSSSMFPPSEDEKWGYDLYPERRGAEYRPSWFQRVFKASGTTQKLNCERNVYACVRTSPLVKLMMAALKSSGCEIDIRRHISCEYCSKTVSGGYDPELNQIVICHNVVNSKGITQGILTHEMIHMFDYCRNNLDFKNIDHLACTEIRAANLTHCSFLSAVFQGDASVFNVKKAQQECVKHKAILSIETVRNITHQQAKEAVERVFPKCYPDTEPIGRRPRPATNDIPKACKEAPLFGYSE